MRKAREIPVGNAREDFNFIDKAAEARSQHESPLRLKMLPGAHEAAIRFNKA